MDWGLTGLTGYSWTLWNPPVRKRPVPKEWASGLSVVRESRFATRCTGRPLRPSGHAGEAVQKAKRQGLSLRAIARKLGMSRVTTTKYALAESPPTKRFSAKERAKAEALAASMVAAD